MDEVTPAAEVYEGSDALAVLIRDSMESTIEQVRLRQDCGEITVAFQEVIDLIDGLVWIAKRNGLGDDPYVLRAEAMLRG